MNHRKNNCSSNVYPQKLSVYSQSENKEGDGDPKAIDFTLVQQLFRISHFYVLCGKLAMATTRLTKMISIWKGQCKKTKLRVLETVVFPTALYGCEAWTINNTDAKRITSFEMKCYRKILRISWMEKVTNKEVLSRLDMLLQKAKTLKLKHFGHIKRHETLERHILEARIDGRKGRGRPTRRWEQDINDWMDMTTIQAGRLAEDRILFRQKVQEATSRQEIS